MRERRRVSSNSPYEDIIGFSRAVRVGDLVFVSGTVAWGPGGKPRGPRGGGGGLTPALNHRSLP